MTKLLLSEIFLGLTSVFFIYNCVWTYWTYLHAAKARRWGTLLFVVGGSGIPMMVFVGAANDFSASLGGTQPVTAIYAIAFFVLVGLTFVAYEVGLLSLLRSDVRRHSNLDVGERT